MMNSQWPILRDRKILVVEDCPQVADIVAAAFNECGAVVTTAATGHGAMRLLYFSRPDLITLDLVMPGEEDGWRVLRFVEQHAPKLLRRTIVLTGRRFDRAVAEKVRAWGLPCIFKPFGLDDLRAAACALLQPAPTVAA